MGPGRDRWRTTSSQTIKRQTLMLSVRRAGSALSELGLHGPAFGGAANQNRTSASGISQVTGLPALAMTISAPRAASHTSRERWVLAAWMSTARIGRLPGKPPRFTAD